jgi:hypothetical protein
VSAASMVVTVSRVDARDPPPTCFLLARSRCTLARLPHDHFALARRYLLCQVTYFTIPCKCA